MKRLLLVILALLPCHSLYAQVYTIDASHVNTTVRSGHLKMGNPGPAGKQLEVNNRYLTLNGKPIIPVMGEMHFSRVPQSRWRETILKMKACGVNIIATYAFWIHHEESEGQFDWTGNKDFRAFIQLCASEGLWVYPRIGPWSHGEVRNGGTPDWMLLKKNIQDRSNDPVYQYYADRWYGELAAQMKGLLYKDGGPVIGVQLENEYRRGKGGEAHILWLKQTALKHGIDVPLYTVTGWGNASVPANEVLPLYGAYPDEPWASNLERSVGCENFRFTPFRDDSKIGNGAGNKAEQAADNNTYPYFTCETGVGIENTEHRRLDIGALDGLTLITQKIGSGSNLPGYYMFAGGSNPVGLFSTLQEDKKETGYYNSNPVISYDFQAAIRESGALNASYYQVKKLHYFLNEFGNTLAPMQSAFPASDSGLSYVVRADEQSAYLFGINYCRNHVQAPVKGVQFSIQLAHEKIVFPLRPVTITDSSVFIWPLHFVMDGAVLQYATAQPLCHIGHQWVFIQDAVAAPELSFDAATVEKIEPGNGKLQRLDERYVITGLRPGMDCVVTVYTKGGGMQQLVLLSEAEALQAWLFEGRNGKQLIVSAADLYQENNHLVIHSKQREVVVNVLGYMGSRKPGFFGDGKQHGAFTSFTATFTAQQPEITYKEAHVLDNAQWLQSNNAKALDKKNVLLHRFFAKELNITNSAEIKSAVLYLGTQQEGEVQINNRWVNQSVTEGALNRLDVTGYVGKGANNLLIAFPFTEGVKVFAGKLEVTFCNDHRVIFYTDSTWLTRDNYNYPSYLNKAGGFKVPEPGVAVPELNGTLSEKTYYIHINKGSDAGLSNLYLRILYNGDKAALRAGSHLLADDFNNGTPWTLGLLRYPQSLTENDLELHITPLPPSAKVYFDHTVTGKDALLADLKKIDLEPEYENSVYWF